ncbi:MAG TPA: heme-binding protein [Usitatibacter sp.]|nr:heme-binding protein [Usitatibacter sp.]
MKRIALAIAAFAALSAFAQVANEPTISADAALDIAAGALRHCRAEGQKVSVTVVDAAGRVKASVRDDGAAPHTAEHSMRKAYTALSYKMPSSDYGKRAAEAKGVAIGPQLLPNITTAAGGVPIRSGSSVIGAVGVSGTPSSGGGGEHDAKCAEAGIARVLPAKN